MQKYCLGIFAIFFSALAIADSGACNTNRTNYKNKISELIDNNKLAHSYNQCVAHDSSSANCIELFIHQAPASFNRMQTERVNFLQQQYAYLNNNGCTVTDLPPAAVFVKE